jgi:hypothetical protein
MITPVNLQQWFGPSAGLLVVQLGIVLFDWGHRFGKADLFRASSCHVEGEAHSPVMGIPALPCRVCKSPTP